MANNVLCFPLNCWSRVADTVDGKPAPDQEWYEFFAQLNGTILSLWDAAAADEAAFMGGQSVMPQFINITDSIITSPSAQEQADHQNVLAINTAGSNKYLFEFQNPNVLKRWSAAFRIAVYERVSLQECYTAALIARSRTAPNVRRLFSTYHGALGSKGKYSGWVRVRFSWSIKWQRCWAVVSDTPSSWSSGSGHAIHERLIHKFSSKQQSLRGEIRFYDSRRDPKNKPIAILSNVYSAFAVYPEKSFLVDQSTMIKVEGSLHAPKGSFLRGDQYKDAFVLLMPEEMPTLASNSSSPNSSPIVGSNASTFAPTARSRFSTASFLAVLNNSSHKPSSSATFESMLTWLVAFYDAFSLYGRPDKLITDSSHKNSMIFAMPSSLEESYLDVEEVFLTLADQGQLETNTYSSQEWRARMKELTLAQLKQGKRPFNAAILVRNAAAEAPIITQPVAPYLRGSVEAPTGLHVHQESTPTVHLPSLPPEGNQPQPYPAPIVQRQPSRRNVLRRKSARLESGDVHTRDFDEDHIESTRVAVKRFSLNEDSEDDSGPGIFRPRVAPPSSYQSSPLRNSEIGHSTSGSVQPESGMESPPIRIDQPVILTRVYSHRRAHSETRMEELYREAKENKREHNSDEESDDRLPVGGRVSTDMFQGSPSPFLETRIERGLRESVETGTRFNNTFDRISHPRDPSHLRLSESSSERSETPADPLNDTPRMEPVNLQSSPATSVESLPSKSSQSRRSLEDKLDNADRARALPAEATFSAPTFRDLSHPTVLVPVNGQSVPTRRDPSPLRTQNVQGPRTALRKPVPIGQPTNIDDAFQYNQDIMRPREHRPAPPAPNHGKFPPAVDYSAHPAAPRPQQLSGKTPYNSIQELQMRARGSPPQSPREPHLNRDPYIQNPYPYVYDLRYNDNPDHKLVRRMVSNQQHPNTPSHSAYGPRPSSSANSSSVSSHTPRPGIYPQGPRQFSSQS